MNPISVPTDNFYKFCLVVGVLLLAASAATPAYFHDRLYESKLFLEKDLKIHKEKFRYLDQLQGELLGELTETADECYPGRSVEILKERISEYNAKVQECSLIEGGLTVRRKLLDARSEKFFVGQLIAALLGIFGIFLVVFGGFRWLQRTQMLEDKILELKAQIDEPPKIILP